MNSVELFNVKGGAESGTRRLKRDESDEGESGVSCDETSKNQAAVTSWTPSLKDGFVSESF